MKKMTTNRWDKASAFRYLAMVLLALTLSLPLAACGKRGAPVPPEDEKSHYPRTYPSPASY
jgi:predicted small lipoprotein YifL